jgi:hypothetical protein
MVSPSRLRNTRDDFGEVLDETIEISHGFRGFARMKNGGKV